MREELAIEAENLGKRYRLGISGRHNTLRDLIVDRAKSLVNGKGRQRPPKGDFWALNGATFEIGWGEAVGIIGLNGAGKSTLLKILSRIIEPTAGNARISGRVGALLEIGTGFHRELTGRENVYLNGAILGMRKGEIRRQFDAIVEFSEIKDFIDTPVKNYSSGMYVRLAFAVAAHLQPDVLMLDEVLSVGDLPFQRKCMEFAKGLQKANATILFVSHNMFSVKTMCSRVIYLRKGQVQFDGPTEEGIRLYEDDCRLSTWGTEDRSDQWPIVMTDFGIFDENGTESAIFDHGDRIKVRVRYETHQPVQDPNFILAFVRSDGVVCCNYSTEDDGISIGDVSGEGVIELQTPPLKLISEAYTVNLLVREKGFQKLLCAQIGSSFHIRHHLYDVHFGVFHEPGEWSVKNGDGNGQLH